MANFVITFLIIGSSVYFFDVDPILVILAGLLIGVFSPISFFSAKAIRAETQDHLELVEALGFRPCGKPSKAKWYLPYPPSWTFFKKSSKITIFHQVLLRNLSSQSFGSHDALDFELRFSIAKTSNIYLRQRTIGFLNKFRNFNFLNQSEMNCFTKQDRFYIMTKEKNPIVSRQAANVVNVLVDKLPKADCATIGNRGITITFLLDNIARSYKIDQRLNSVLKFVTDLETRNLGL